MTLVMDYRAGTCAGAGLPLDWLARVRTSSSLLRLPPQPLLFPTHFLHPAYRIPGFHQPHGASLLSSFVREQQQRTPSPGTSRAESVSPGPSSPSNGQSKISLFCKFQFSKKINFKFQIFVDDHPKVVDC
jgi:hypothetical protein